MSTPTRIELTSEQRTRLEQLIRAGKKTSARQLTRARILLLSDNRQPGQWKSAPAVARALLVHANTVRNVRRRFVRAGLAAALGEQPRTGAPPKLTGEIEAQLTALACGPAPRGPGPLDLAVVSGQTR
jgi:hypothetical protein